MKKDNIIINLAISVTLPQTGQKTPVKEAIQTLKDKGPDKIYESGELPPTHNEGDQIQLPKFQNTPYGTLQKKRAILKQAMVNRFSRSNITMGKAGM